MFSEKILKGIPNSQSYNEYGVTSALFPFNKESPVKEKENWWEESINWSDEDQSVEYLLNQKKNGSNDFQFKEGIAVFLREEIDRVILKKKLREKLKYDRDGIPHKYHGNILMHKSVPNPFKKMIISWIGFCYEYRIPRP